MPSGRLLTLPDFNIAHKKIIDNLLTANKEKLQKKLYLVTDARSNGGGWDAFYKPILTYLLPEFRIRPARKAN